MINATWSIFICYLKNTGKQLITPIWKRIKSWFWQKDNQQNQPEICHMLRWRWNPGVNARLWFFITFIVKYLYFSLLYFWKIELRRKVQAIVIGEVVAVKAACQLCCYWIMLSANHLHQCFSNHSYSFLYKAKHNNIVVSFGRCVVMRRKILDAEDLIHCNCCSDHSHYVIVVVGNMGGEEELLLSARFSFACPPDTDSDKSIWITQL